MKTFTEKIRKLVYAKKYFIRRHHIENERIYREIQAADVEIALKNGQFNRIRQETNNVFWRGQDVDGRQLELMLTLLEDDGEETLVIEDAKQVKVETAYEPGKDDKELLMEWLKNHSNYEEAKNGKGVRRKVEVITKRTKVRRKE